MIINTNRFFISMSRLSGLLLATLVHWTAEAGEPEFVLQNELCRYVVGRDGTNVYFGTPDGQHNVCEPGQSFMQVCVGGQTYPASKVRFEQSSYHVEFAGTGVTVRVQGEAKPDYLALTVTEVQGEAIQWLRLVNLRLAITHNVGPLVNAAWDEKYAACVLACNDRTESFGADGSTGNLCAQCYPEFGLAGGAGGHHRPAHAMPEPDRTLLAAIGRVELAEGLPHPLLDGVWFKESPERFRSYLMVHDLGEANVDEIIRIARGGFGCIEFYPWRSTPSYEINPSLFPHGLEGLKTVCDKIHAAGMQVGLHVMQGMVGWGPKDDRYLVPRADPRLLQDRQGVLAADIDAQTTTLILEGGPRIGRDHGDLYVDGEIIRYATRTDTGFIECQRGLHGTTADCTPGRYPCRTPRELLPDLGRHGLLPEPPQQHAGRDLRSSGRGVQRSGCGHVVLRRGRGVAGSATPLAQHRHICLGSAEATQEAGLSGRQCVLHAFVLACHHAGQSSLRPDPLRTARIHAAIQRHQPGQSCQESVDWRRGLVRASRAFPDGRRGHAGRGAAVVPESAGRQSADLLQRQCGESVEERTDAGDAGDHSSLR